MTTDNELIQAIDQALDERSLAWASKWIEDSLLGETNERVIEFGRNMAMTLRAAAISPAAPVVDSNELISRRDAIEIANARLGDVPDRVDLEADRSLFAAGYLAAAGSIKAGLQRAAAATAAPEQSDEDLPLITENPFEQIVERALIRAGIVYQTDHDGSNPTRLDFYLPKYDVHIEVKTMHSERVAEQMSRAANVVVAQGGAAIKFLAQRIESHSRLSSTSARAATEEIIKAWLWHTPEHDQDRARVSITAIIERYYEGAR